MPRSKTFRPLDLVKLCLNERVHIKLRGNRELVGVLHGFDQHLNLMVQDVKETLKYLETDPETLEESVKVVVRDFELLYIRGDIVILISPMVSVQTQ